MFWNKKCENCNNEIRGKWNFCPSCGANLVEKPFSTIFEDVNKEFESMEKTFKTDFRFPKFRLNPPVRSSGVSITITSGTGMQPKVEVKTSGKYKKLEPEIKNRSYPKEPVSEIEDDKKVIKAPKITEEPATRIQRLGNKQIITINLPDVKEEDVQIKQLEQSIEIKAFAGDKGYFKLIPIPANAYVGKEFKDGVLKIEVVR